MGNVENLDTLEFWNVRYGLVDTYEQENENLVSKRRLKALSIYLFFGNI